MFPPRLHLNLLKMKMKKKISVLFISAPILFGAFGCSSDSPKASEEEKKSFMGGPMPKDFMKQQQAGAAAAQKAAADAAAKNGNR
ncbi:hypothetical protein BH11ARM2_BH11ARM2_36800 [soil metagenome]